MVNKLAHRGTSVPTPLCPVPECQFLAKNQSGLSRHLQAHPATTIANCCPLALKKSGIHLCPHCSKPFAAEGPRWKQHINACKSQKNSNFQPVKCHPKPSRPTRSALHSSNPPSQSPHSSDPLPSFSIDVPGDGNCFFRCVSLGLYHTEEKHQELRKSVANYMRLRPPSILSKNLPTIFHELFDKKAFTSQSAFESQIRLHSRKLDQQGEFTNAIDIYFTAEYLNCRINIFSRFSEDSGLIHSASFRPETHEFSLSLIHHAFGPGHYLLGVHSRAQLNFLRSLCAYEKDAILARKLATQIPQDKNNQVDLAPQTQDSIEPNNPLSQAEAPSSSSSPIQAEASRYPSRLRKQTELHFGLINYSSQPELLNSPIPSSSPSSVHLPHPNDYNFPKNLPVLDYLSIANHPPVLQKVPQSGLGQFISLARDPLRQFRLHSEQSNSSGQAESLARFLRTAQLLFTVGPNAPSSHPNNFFTSQDDNFIRSSVESAAEMSRNPLNFPPFSCLETEENGSIASPTRSSISGESTGSPCLEPLSPPSSPGSHISFNDSFPDTEIAEETSAPSHFSLNSPTSPSFASQTPSHIRKAKALLRQGFISRSYKALSNTQPPTSLSENEPAYKKLLSLHPFSETNTVIPDLPSADQLPPKVTLKEIAPFLKKLCTGSAPGPSGFTMEHLYALCDDPEIHKDLTFLVQQILNGDLPDSCRNLLLSSRLIAIPKDRDSHDPSNIRPISVGETLYRLAASIAVSSVAQAASELLSPIQFGVSVSNGAELIAHNLQHLLERTDFASGPLAALAIDCKNAFNSISRAHIFRVLYQFPQLNSVWRLAHWAYRSASPLLIRNHERLLFHGISSAQGVKQGDPLSSLLFSLAMHPIYQKIHQEMLQSTAELYPQIPPEKISFSFAYLDDLTLVGRPEALQHAFKLFRKLAAEICLEVQPQKSSLLYLHQFSQPLTNSLVKSLEELRIPLNYEGQVILGVPISISHPFIADFLQTRLRNLFSQLKLLLNPHLSAQESLLWTRQCLIPQFQYHCRTIRPLEIGPAARSFDQLIRSAIKSLLHLDQNSLSPAEEALFDSQFHLPLRHGGLGTISAFNSMNLSYLASISECARSSNCNARAAFSSYLNHGKLNSSCPLGIQLNSALKFLSLHCSPSNKTTNSILIPETANFFSVLERFNCASHSNPGPLSCNRTITDQFNALASPKTPNSSPSNDLPSKNNKSKSQDQWPFDSNRLLRQFHLNQFRLRESFFKQRSNAPSHLEIPESARKLNLHLIPDPARQMIRLNSVAKPGSHLWLTALPMTPRMTISDSYFITAARLRLGLDPYSPLPKSCFICSNNAELPEPQFRSPRMNSKASSINALESNPYHHLCCRALLSTHLTARHDLIKHCIARFAKRALIDVAIEPRKLDPNSCRRVDLQLFIENQTALVDVSLVHPTAPSNVRLASSRSDPSASLNRRAQSKIQHHASAARFQHSKFIPFVVESFGGFHSDCFRLLQLIRSSFANFSSSRSTAEFHLEFLQSISVAIQRGNALALLKGCQLNSLHSSRSALSFNAN